MKRALFFLLGFAVIGGGALSLLLGAPKREIHRESASLKKATSKNLEARSVAQVPTSAASVTDLPSPKGEPTAIERFIQKESSKVGKPDPDPSATQRKLKAVAESLKKMDIQSLKRSALDHSLNNDQRFLSVYLLALSSSPETKAALFSIASDPLSIQDISSRLYAEELMIRTQALEGLGKHQPPRGRGPLDDFLARQDNSFLADQAQRILRERRARR